MPSGSAGELRPGKTLVIWGERLGRGPDGAAALGSLLNCLRALNCSADTGGGFSVPDGANARGSREVGCLPGAGPGFAAADPGRNLEQIKQGLLDAELDGVILLHADPVRDLPDGPGWAKALNQARTVVAISNFDDASTKAADIVLPAEAYAEKEGTVTHPDGRLQRLRPSVPRPDLVHPIWQVLAELAAALGDETGVDSAPEALDEIAATVPFYAGLTPDEIGGTGVRWQEREQASSFDRGRAAGGRRRRRRRRATAASASAHTATSGRARSRIATSRSGSWPPSSGSSWRRRTPSTSSSATATRSRFARTARAFGRGSCFASGCGRARRS